MNLIIRCNVLHPPSRSAQRLPHGRHRVPPGSTLRALARERAGGGYLGDNLGPAERRPPPNAVRASPERSDSRAPVNSAAGRALAASDSEQWARPEARSRFAVRLERMMSHGSPPMNDRAGRHYPLSDTSVVWCRDPRSGLVLLDVVPYLIFRDPVFLTHPDRLQALGFDHLPHSLGAHFQDVGHILCCVKNGDRGHWCTARYRHMHLISLPRGA